MERKLLFSVTIKDCRVETMRGSGPGGQHRNKTESGVRITHSPSGAVGQATEHKSQLMNKREAFKRMAETLAMKAWCRAEAARLQGRPSIDELVEKSMAEENIRTEVKDAEGRWTQVDVSTLSAEEESENKP